MAVTDIHHIFNDHLLKKQHLDPVINFTDEQIWPSLFLFICLGALSLVKVNAFSKMVRVIQSIFSRQVFQQLEREESGVSKGHSIILNVFFILNLAFLMFKINSIYNIILSETPAVLQFLFFLTVITVTLFFKVIMNNLLIVFTGERKLISEYSVSSRLVDQAFGILIFPWIVLMQFTTFNPLIFISVAILVLAFSLILKWYRGVLIGLIDQRIGLLQIFSYFCGLEILPVFVLVKFLIQTF
ncbi:MAG: DUF4271 domain-containing protein [Bacteroidia bacterium]|nr:DUF4271 domain-containing protein [Bacteroidia bacterium]